MPGTVLEFEDTVMDENREGPGLLGSLESWGVETNNMNFLIKNHASVCKKCLNK